MTIDNQKLEEMIGEVKSQMDLEKKTAEIVAEKADALVKSNLDQIEILHKSIEALTAKVDQLNVKLEALQVPSIEEIEKSITSKLEINAKEVDTKVEEIQKTVEKLADEPIRKSVVTIEEPVVKVEVVAEPKKETVQDLINLAMDEIKKGASEQRGHELRRAIIALDSGVNPNNYINIIKK